MSWVARTMGSSIGAKAVMAITGMVLVGFVLAHMAGNMLMFAGKDAFNAYAETLQSLGGVLWAARIVLLGAVFLHIASAIRLTRQNAAARPVPYRVVKPEVSSYATRTMRVSGFILLAFIVYHLLHFTAGIADPEIFKMKAAGDVYGMVVAGFSQPLVAGSYGVAMVLLSMHLSHGISSLFQSLGWNHPKYNGAIRKIGPTLGTLVALGFLSIPVAVLTGIVTA